MKHIFRQSVGLLLLGLLACQTNLTGTTGSIGDATFNAGATEVTEVNAHANERPSTFAVSSFSEYVYTDNANQKLLIDWNFFPSTQYDSEAKNLLLPCDAENVTTTAEGLTYSESIPLGDSSCSSGVLLDLSDATFETYGLVFAFSGTLNVLADDFDISITSTGFKSTQGESLSLESATDADLVAVLAAF